MNAWVVLLRGINVGGKNIVPMKQLANSLESIGCAEVKTYIQSGNLVLQHPISDRQLLATEIAQKVQQDFDCSPKILVLGVKEFEQAALNNPFPKAESEPKTLHLFFLIGQTTDTKLSELAKLKKDSESFQLLDSVLYLHAPEGVGRSKLVEKVDKCLGVSTTARNWNTVKKLIALSG